MPRVFQQAFHLMRSGRPGPVLVDLPIDVQMAEIEFDIDTYEPLPVYKPKATRAQIEKALTMLNDADKPLIVSGGGVLNAAAEDLLVEFAETLGVPVIPTLMSWGAIPDDHPLMAGMCGLQTSHRYGNATMLASDFVLGIGNRWANRHTGSVEVYTKGRKFVHVDIEPTQIGRVFGPDLGIVSDAKLALELFVEVAQGMEGRGQAEGPRRMGQGLPGTQAHDASQDALRKRADEAAARLRRDEPGVLPRYLLRHDDRSVADCGRAVPACVQGAQLDQLWSGRPARLDDSGSARRACSGPAAPDRRALGRLRLPVHDRGTRGRRAIQAAVHPHRREQLLPWADPPGAARLRDGLLRAARVRQHQRA